MSDYKIDCYKNKDDAVWHIIEETEFKPINLFIDIMGTERYCVLYKKEKK